MTQTGTMIKKGKKQRRLFLIGAVGVVLVAAMALVLTALDDQIALFKSPSDIANEGIGPGVRLRVGGLVKEGSWKRTGTGHEFVVTDSANDLPATYGGIVPDLFREGQGVVLEGSVSPEGVFVADTVLAKHDENYVPKEVAEALKQQGVWKPGEPLPPTN
ncbi:MAG: cytochrome c maturation protein CcmE [Pseudomonadota bacterium]